MFQVEDKPHMTITTEPTEDFEGTRIVARSKFATGGSAAAPAADGAPNEATRLFMEQMKRDLLAAMK
jgi:hypothetical protein